MQTQARKIIVGVVGFTLLVAGAILFVLPTPVGWIIVPASLIVLSTEYQFARRWLIILKRRTGWVGRKFRRAESGARRYAARVMARMPLAGRRRSGGGTSGLTAAQTLVATLQEPGTLAPSDSREEQQEVLPTTRAGFMCACLLVAGGMFEWTSPIHLCWSCGV